MNPNVKSILMNTALAMLMAVFAVLALAQDHSQPQAQGLTQGENQTKDMEPPQALFADNKKVKRSVKKIPNGIEATTESNDPKVKAMIVEHAFAMKERLINKQPVRGWDPLFAELFEHADKINLQITETAKGVKVVETSADPYVVQLIQSHAQSISEFAKEGMASMHKRHELPGARPEANRFLGKGDGVTACPVSGEPVNQTFRAEILGRTVYFCCANCRDAVKKNPELYLKKP